MKKLIIVIAVGLLTGVTYGGELSKADQKWSAVVEKMIEEGATTISTPDENRAKLARRLADKHGRKSTLEKTEKGYRVKFQAVRKVETASK